MRSNADRLSRVWPSSRPHLLPTLSSVSPDLQTEQRCPRCRALVRPGTPWCTLCYADLRPTPERVTPERPATEPADLVPAVDEPAVAAAAALPVTTQPFDPLTAPIDALEGPPPVPAGVDRAASSAVTWPCHRCGERVPFDDGICRSCGAVFLDGASEADPVLRRFGSVSSQAKVVIMLGGSAAMAAIFLGLMYLLGALF